MHHASAETTYIGETDDLDADGNEDRRKEDYDKMEGLRTAARPVVDMEMTNDIPMND
jgi:hypothetical protein